MSEQIALGSLETELEIPASSEANEARTFVTIISETSNNLVGQLFDIISGVCISNTEYKQMIINELKLRMKAKKL